MKLTTQNTRYFTEQLMHWHKHENDRALPWKEEKDPYKIWLSEIILQQTRAEQGMPYYLRFVNAYPKVQDLAAANDDDVFKLWQGLGYYNRCKNMLASARYIVATLNGKFPTTYEGLLALKGVGSYTAAAIGSFAFGLPNAVVDGNVYRVLSRYLAIDTPIDTTEGKKLFAELAGEFLDKGNSASYNQAIMDFGAMVCAPKQPNCDTCPLANKCVGRKQNLIHLLPVKSKKVIVKNRFFHYIVVESKKEVWIRKRGKGDIWENLFEPFLIEGKQELSQKQIEGYLRKEKIKIVSLTYEGAMKQRLTHQSINFQFYKCYVEEMPILSGGIWVKKEQLDDFSFPKTLVSFYEKKLYF